jgi:hypothetical protein
MPDYKIVNNYAVVEFFQLDIEEALHCFSFEKQNIERYGGQKLTVNSTPKDVANNIFSFLETRVGNKTEKQMLFVRRVLIEKVQMAPVKIVKRKKRN